MACHQIWSTIYSLGKRLSYLVIPIGIFLANNSVVKKISWYWKASFGGKRCLAGVPSPSLFGDLDLFHIYLESFYYGRFPYYTPRFLNFQCLSSYSLPPSHLILPFQVHIPSQLFTFPRKIYLSTTSPLLCT